MVRETTVRLYVVPFLGSKRLDRLTVQDMRGWLNKLALVGDPAGAPEAREGAGRQQAEGR
ncbi:hypothetical protein [Streptomyces sp. NPDC047869]|uniref:hypothetical protein n=1 Tax=Streptomyces sp. NPDC047869 TaxID=3154709 RepID=UPI0034529966